MEEIAVKFQRKPREIEESLRQRVDSKISGKKRERLFRFMAENVHLESLSTTNARVGRILSKARAYARQNNIDEIYFYSGKGRKSPDLIKRILIEGYGVGTDKFLPYRTGLSDYWNGSQPPQNPLILVIDDFIGTGDQMEVRIESVREMMKHFGLSSGEVHAFSPIVTPTGASKISKITHLFYDLVIPENVIQNFSDLNLPTDYTKSASTALFFEYMAPDNNVQGLREFFDFWTRRDLEVTSSH